MTTMLPATETTTLTPEQVLQRDWATNPRWAGIERSYTSADVVNLRGSWWRNRPWPRTRGAAVAAAARPDLRPGTGR